MTTGKRRSKQSARRKLRSPGRPGVARQSERRRFWSLIALGISSEDAAARTGISQPVQNVGLREIARRLGRAASTISREIRRNAATRSGGFEYRATTAQWHAERSAERPTAAKLATNADLRQYVQDRLSGYISHPGGSVVVGPPTTWKGRRHGRPQSRRWTKAWSPEQIAGRLRIDFPGDETMRISHEAIYQALYIQGRGALRRELTACLRTGRALRVPRARTAGRGKSFVTSEIMISERPAEAADRAVPGHWEGDFIIGLNRSAIGTLVERQTRLTLSARTFHGCPGMVTDHA